MLTVQECSQYLHDLLTSYDHVKTNNTRSNTAIKLLNHLANSDMNIVCGECSNSGNISKYRGFLQKEPFQIVLCANRIQKREIEEVLVHESTHAYDLINKKVDFNTCEGLAYSEIRAARNADCANDSPLTKDACISYRALLSTACSHSESDAMKCITSQYSKAMKDIEPN